MVTFSNLMESKGRMDGDMMDLSEKFSRAFRREGSLKEGEEIGLCGALSRTTKGVLDKGVYSSIVKGGGEMEEVVTERFKGGWEVNVDSTRGSVSF